MTLQLAQAQPQRVRSLSLFEPIPFHLLPDGDAGLAELHSVRRQVEASLKNDDARAGTACSSTTGAVPARFRECPKPGSRR